MRGGRTSVHDWDGSFARQSRTFVATFFDFVSQGSSDETEPDWSRRRVIRSAVDSLSFEYEPQVSILVRKSIVAICTDKIQRLSTTLG